MKLFSIFEDENGEQLEVADKQARESITDINQTLGELVENNIINDSIIENGEWYSNSTDSAYKRIKLGVIKSNYSYTIFNNSQDIECIVCYYRNGVRSDYHTVGANTSYTIKDEDARLYFQKQGVAITNNMVTSNFVVQLNSIGKETADINSNLSGSQVDVAYKSHFGVLTANAGRYGYEWNNLTKGQYTLKATNTDNSLYIYVGYKRNGELSTLGNIAPHETKEFVFNAQENDTILMWLDSGMSTNIFSNVSLLSWQIGKEVDNINDSLSEYGLVNIFDRGKLRQGYYDCSSGKTINDFVNNNNNVSTNPYICNGGDTIHLIMDRTKTYGNNIIAFYDNNNNYISYSRLDGNYTEHKCIAPTNATKFTFMCYSTNTSISSLGNIYLYVNNAIDKLKADLPISVRENTAPRCILTDNKDTITSEYGFTYESLSAMLNDGSYVKYIRDKDYIRLTDLSGATFNLVFNINTYKNYGDNSVGSHIDLISQHSIPASYGWQMRTENTNNGTSAETSPYLASINMIDNLKQYFDNNIPAKLKSHIVTKRLLLPTRYSESGTLTDDNSWKWTDLGKMWLPFEEEIAGKNVWSTKQWQGGLRQYPCFQDGSQITKNLGENGSRNSWWTASAHSGSTTYFVYVSIAGDIAGNSASHTWLAVPLCMRFK